jgi:hypothetical protein
MEGNKMELITITRQPGWEDLDQDLAMAERDTIPEAQKPEEPEPIIEETQETEESKTTEVIEEDHISKRRRTPYDETSYLYPDKSQN